MSTGLKANVDGSAAIQVGGVDAITLTSAGAASFVTSPTTVQAGTAAAPSITTSGDTNTGIFFPAADTIAFAEGGAEALRINSSGTVVLSGGDTSANGTGITFPATQSASSNANTLDDYEEGTFTPTAFGASTAGTTTYSSRSGAYTKIGNQVTVWIYVGVTGMTGTGNLIIGGLPFAQNSNTSTLSIGACMTNNLDYPAGLTCPVLIGEANLTSMRMFASGDNVGWSAIAVDSSFELHACATYYV